MLIVNHLFHHCKVLIGVWSHFIGRCCLALVFAIQRSHGWEGVLLCVGIFFGGCSHLLSCGLFGGKGMIGTYQ